MENRKESEEFFKNNNKELKETLDELKLVQKKLIQQEKLAGIGQLAAGVAHEINNPLGYIYSNIETSRAYFNRYKNMVNIYEDFIENLPKDSSDKVKSKIADVKIEEKKNDLNFISEDIEDLFNDVEQGLKKISEIVNSLKTFSRVDQTEDLEEYDLNKGIKNTLMIARNEIKYHARVVEMLGDLPKIRTLGNQIDQVLLNIFLNAAHAIRAKEIDGLGLIFIQSYVAEGYLHCEIEDNGIGIDEYNIKKIFDPFFTTKVTGEGTGFGLSIAYDIIANRCGGEILVNSIPNVKTKFTIKLPMDKKEEEFF